ncbi:MAG TPA: hypothetical protein PLG73_07505, partial [Candidatus Sumerlaeota bacterium]|nr:hypothetical protein [Candidatus Sumerlaeota bacterium]
QVGLNDTLVEVNCQEANAGQKQPIDVLWRAGRRGLLHGGLKAKQRRIGGLSGKQSVKAFSVVFH